MIPKTDSEQVKLKTEIVNLKKEKHAVILAHYYQEPEIQDIADFVGDSLGLSQQAAATPADIIVFAGVHFMAETAKIINPQKKVLLPDLNAGCSLADSCPPELFREFINKHPDHFVVTYVNCSAEIKTMSDVVCTSSNALEVIHSIPPEKKIIFAPDKNLGKYLSEKTGRKMLLWDGACEVHEAFSLEKLKVLKSRHKAAEIVAHPESQSAVLALADFIGSTSAMLHHVINSPKNEFIIATEAGILHQMKAAAPGKTFIPAPAYQNNSCACSECSYMKMNTLEKLYQCLKYEAPEIILSESIIDRAYLPISKMLKLSAEKFKPSYENCQS